MAVRFVDGGAKRIAAASLATARRALIWSEMPEMITVVGSLKGGSGKSTVTFNLAVWLTLAECKVIAIDADPQATLTDVVDVRNEEGFEPTFRLGGGEMLDDSDALNEADEVVIDVGTAGMDAMKRALTIADRVVVPVPPSQADIWSTQRFVQFVWANTDPKNPPEIVGFINRGDTHRAVRETDEAAAALVALPGIRFLKPRLAQRTVFRRSFSEGLAVFELDRRSKGTMEWHALAAVLYPNVLS